MMSRHDDDDLVDPDDATWDDALLDSLASARQEAERLGRRKKKGKGGKQVLRTVRAKKKSSPRGRKADVHSRRAKSPPTTFSGPAPIPSSPRAKSPDPSMFRKDVTLLPPRPKSERHVGEADPFYPNDLNTMRFSRHQHHDKTLNQVAINLNVILIKKDNKLFRAICSELNSALYTKMGSALLSVLNERAMELLEYAITWIVGKTRGMGNPIYRFHKALLFRVDSLGVSLMNTALKKMGSDYLTLVLRPVIEHVMRMNGPSEVDPVRIPEGEDTTAALTSATNHLRQGCKIFLDTFTETAEDIPLGIRRILWCIVRAARGCFEGISVAGCLSGTFFLRFLCPVLLDPEKHGLISSIEGANLRTKHRRSLLLISKVIQALANGILFGDKEDFMIPMNSFVEENIAVCERTLTDISSMPKEDGPFEFLGFENVSRDEQRRAEKNMVRIVADMQEDICAYFVKNNEMAALSEFSAAMNPSAIFPSPKELSPEVDPSNASPSPKSSRPHLVGNMGDGFASATPFRCDSSAPVFESLTSDDDDPNALGNSIRPGYRPTSFSAMPVMTESTLASSGAPDDRLRLAQLEDLIEPTALNLKVSGVPDVHYQALDTPHEDTWPMTPSVRDLLVPHAAEILSIVTGSHRETDASDNVLRVLAQVFRSAEALPSTSIGAGMKGMEPKSPPREPHLELSSIDRSPQQQVEDADARGTFLEKRVSFYAKKHERLRQQLTLYEKLNAELKATAKELSTAQCRKEGLETEYLKVKNENEKLRQRVALFEQMNGELKQALETQRQVVVDLKNQLTAAKHPTTLDPTPDVEAPVLPPIKTSLRLARGQSKPSKASRGVESLLRLNPTVSSQGPKTEPIPTMLASKTSSSEIHHAVPRKSEVDVQTKASRSRSLTSSSSPSASTIKTDGNGVLASMKATVKRLRDVTSSSPGIKCSSEPVRAYYLPVKTEADVREISFPNEWFTPQEQRLVTAAGTVSGHRQRTGSMLLRAWEDPPGPPSRPVSSETIPFLAEPISVSGEGSHTEPFKSWSVPRVCHWLEMLGLGQYSPVVRESCLTGAVLAVLSADDLKEYGVTSLGHRKRLQKAIREELRRGSEENLENSIKIEVTFEEEKDILMHMATTVLGKRPSPDIALAESRPEFYDLLTALLEMAESDS